MGSRLPLGDHLNAGWGPAPTRRSFERRMGGRALETMQNMGRWGPRDHPLEKCVEKMPSADCKQAGYLRIFRQHPIRSYFAYEKTTHFSNGWALRGRSRSFFQRMGTQGHGAAHFSQRMCTWWTRGGSMAPRAGGPSRNVADVPRGRAGALVRARTDAGESTRCCDNTFRINDTEQYRVR